MAKEIDFLADDPAGAAPARGRARASTADDAGAGDDAAFIVAAALRHNVHAGAAVAKRAQGKTKTKQASGIVSGGGSFQSMGLHPSLLRALLLRGFTTPTPIQRRAIPAVLAQPSQDVVGMARTGSGKTLAYLLPLIQRLNGRHSTSFGVKSLVLCPSRELALQILKVGKDLARGWRSEDGEAIRWALIVGGDGMDQQFAMMAANPDVVIATPGRLLHLVVEMNLDLRAVEYVVFDEADRLFEMGFQAQLEELLRRLPPTRQTLLFSATLPKTLVEFARAGLDSNPKLIRLDAESKISPDLRMAFFSVKPSDKDAALLLLLRDVICVPTGGWAGGDGAGDDDDAADSDDDEGGGSEGDTADEADGRAAARTTPRKRAPPPQRSARAPKRARPQHADQLRPYQTIVFCATKHHVEYLLLVLTTMGYACSHIYSSLDQTARAIQMRRFREGRTAVLVVTDIAARGIDLPVLEHVVNYDFPPQPRIFVHRVGRTARAGRPGWAWTLCTHAELPYLCDLQLFLARPLVSSHTHNGTSAAMDLAGTLAIGTFPREEVDAEGESIQHALQVASSTATAYEGLVGVVKRAHAMYARSQPKASPESYRRAKEMLKDAERSALVGAEHGWALAGHPLEAGGVHDVLQRPAVYRVGGPHADARVGALRDDPLAAARASLLAKVNAFRPGETVFEVGARGPQAPLAQLMQDRRRTLHGKQQRGRALEAAKRETQSAAPPLPVSSVPQADAEDVAAVFGTRAAPPAVPPAAFRDPEFYLSYEQKGAKEDRGYALGGGSFAEQARSVAVDIAGDDAGPGTASQKPNQHRWDTKKKKFVQGDGAGADNQKMIRTETGLKLPASFRSGRYDEWRRTQRVDMPSVGEAESALPASVRRVSASLHDNTHAPHRGFHHTQSKAPKPVDKLQYGYEAKKKAMDKKGSARAVQSELRSAVDIHRDRAAKEKRREKNARPSARGQSAVDIWGNTSWGTCHVHAP
ncbi:RNA helicase [Malassezia sp. CBS 17886]|nr:RNA helicase [Malassezia sp. CBS 17886]